MGPLVIPALRRMKFGQNIRSDGPARHLAKAGTPTMGGVIILAALIVTVVFFGRGNGEVWLTLFITIGHGNAWLNNER